MDNPALAAVVISVFIVGMFTCVFYIGLILDRKEQMKMCVQSTPYLECHKAIME